MLQEILIAAVERSGATLAMNAPSLDSMTEIESAVRAVANDLRQGTNLFEEVRPILRAKILRGLYAERCRIRCSDLTQAWYTSVVAGGIVGGTPSIGGSIAKEAISGVERCIDAVTTAFDITIKELNCREAQRA